MAKICDLSNAGRESCLAGGTAVRQDRQVAGSCRGIKDLAAANDQFPGLVRWPMVQPPVGHSFLEWVAGVCVWEGRGRLGTALFSVASPVDMIS